MAEETDSELQVISKIVGALDPLSPEAKSRVLEYLFKRFGASLLVNRPGMADKGLLTLGGSQEQGKLMVTGPKDIRSLKAEKSPQSANQMAALVAYYLAEHAPQDERKTAVGSADIVKYFKQAGFRLPESASQTLRHARDAGYLDLTSDRGLYKLNPVGYNLVVHNMPRSGPISDNSGTLQRKGRKRNAGRTLRRNSRSRRRA